MGRPASVLTRIKSEAAKLRGAIEATERDEQTAGNLASFPRQCCDHGVRLLALHLSRLGFGDLKKARGERPSQITYPTFHVWLRWRDVTIDITADQFNEGLPPVVVARRSPWHTAWKPKLEPIGASLLDRWLNEEGGVFDACRAILAKLCYASGERLRP